MVDEKHLTGQAIWATPTARDFRSGKASEETMNRNSRPLNEQATHPGRHAPRSGVSGNESSRSGPTSLQLSPAFVEWLMGLPIGWTGFEPLATPLSLPKLP